MLRLYSMPRFQITRGISDYVDLAYAGDEQVPGMTLKEVRDTVDTMKVTS